MLRVLLSSVLWATVLGGPFGDFPFRYNPKPYKQNIAYEEGNVRITIVTPRLFRMEYSDSGFEDRATTAVVNRYLPQSSGFTKWSGYDPKAKYHCPEGSPIHHFQTPYVQLSYCPKECPDGFSAKCLFARNSNEQTTFQSWHYGEEDSGNLLGTIRSLDTVSYPSLNCTVNENMEVFNESLHCEWGLISRNGWAVLRDEDSPILDADAWFSNDKAKGNNENKIDVYLFAHGDDYIAALKDYALIGGRIPMLPKYALGNWYTRWFDYTTDDVMEQLRLIENAQMTLDGWVFDMNWHGKWAWGGYTWDRRIIPDPEYLMAELKSKGLAVGANLHDDDGVGYYDEAHDPMARAMGLDPKLNANITFDLMNENYVRNLEDVVLGPIMKSGMDFWWIDWQQGGKQGNCTGGRLNPTMILNHVRGTAHARRTKSGSKEDNKRDMVLARWGGMGNHRYPIGFSGDVSELTWKALSYQPYFSATASNVLFGWSHDLTGPAGDPELYVRWLQFGTVSANFRMHDRGGSAGPQCSTNPGGCYMDKPWELPLYYKEPIAKAMRARTALLPYLYTAVHEAHLTGISLLRPMYYHWPKQEMAYAVGPDPNQTQHKLSQYMLGPDLLVAPIVQPADKTAIVNKKVWLPPGEWVDKTSGTMFTIGEDEGRVITRPYTMDEIPMFVKGGAVIPTIPVEAPYNGLASRAISNLEFTIYPHSLGSKSERQGGVDVYDDDGETYNYIDIKQAYRTTEFQYSYQKLKGPGSDQITFAIKNKGKFPGMVDHKRYVVKIANMVAPHHVEIHNNDTIIEISCVGEPKKCGKDEICCYYDASELTANIHIPSSKTENVMGRKTYFVVAWMQDKEWRLTLTSGLKGCIARAVQAKRILDQGRMVPGESSTKPCAIQEASIFAHRLRALVEGHVSSFGDFKQHIAKFRDTVTQALDEIRAMAKGSLYLSQDPQDSPQLMVKKAAALLATCEFSV